mmetsp:Transcript_13213/g.18899  ORF Transcript_13213/g.18899 Transcript_13213/m.18899 type:complete len:206 (+) Transcript_13213:809-1426(+)
MAKEAAKKVGLEELGNDSKQIKNEINSNEGKKLDTADSNNNDNTNGSTTKYTVDSTPKAKELSEAKSPLLSNKEPKDVSKEDLMDVLQKMSKGVKALQALRANLLERVNLAEKDKSRLMDIFKTEVLSEADLEDASQKAAEKNAENANLAAKEDENGVKMGKDSKIDEISMIQLAWRVADERNQFNLQQIQNEYKVISMQLRKLS